MDKITLYHIKAAFDQDGADAAYKEICRVLADSSHESSGLNKPVVTMSLPLSNEQILKGIQTSPRYQLPKEWLKNEHTNSNYMGGFLNAVKWMEGNAR